MLRGNALRLSARHLQVGGRRMSTGPLFLGLDSSTQSLKATVIDSALAVVAEADVNFDADFPAYGTSGGVHKQEDGTVTSPTLLWIDALDTVLGKLKGNVDFSQIAAVSGSGQQHGSVYWKKGAADTLASLAPGSSLKDQLADSFSIPDSPVWMDSSTSEQCALLEESLGGPEAVAAATGSRAYERFTGNQIAKLSSHESFGDTERISLVSSMGATIFAGAYAPIDIADGGGMNLMDIITKDWHKSACAIAGEGVEGLLGPSPVPAHTVVGPISPYFVGEYGFPESCKAVAWSGDNPCAVAGMRLENAGDACISLGTSDTIFALLDEPSPKTEGHIFGSPVDPAGYMALICFLNGSLVRERVREKVGAADWGAFGEILKETSAGNGGSIALHYDDPEITPHVPKAVEAFYNGDDESVDSLPPAEEARAVIEARFISMRVHAEFIGLKMDRIYATGGASQNNDITQVIADVFGCDVYTMASPGGAPLGAAYRALHALKCEEMGEYVPYGQTLRDAEAEDAEPHVSIAATPDADRHATYSAMVPRFAELEQKVIASCE